MNEQADTKNTALKTIHFIKTAILEFEQQKVAGYN